MSSNTFENEEWYKKPLPKFKDISFEEFKKLKIKVDIALVVATETEHYYTLKEIENISSENNTYKIQYKKQTYFIGTFGQYIAVIIRANSMGAHSASTAVTDLIITWNPHAIISVGIAMGYDKDKHKPGNVIVSSSIVDYDNEKIKNGKHYNRSIMPRVSEVLLNRFQNEFNWEFSRPDSSICKKHIGLLLTGNKLINDPKFKAKLWSRFPDAIGAEMEGTGVYSAADSKDKEWIIIKAICDWGDGDKNDDYQELASASAVSLCKSVFTSENALNGVVKTNYNTSQIARINSFKLFFHRKDLKKYSIEKITHLSKISSAKIRQYEKINTDSSNLSLDIFPKCTKGDLNKIERALKCPKGFLNVENSDDYYSYFLTYYFKNKLKDGSLLFDYTKTKAIIFDFDGTLTTSDIKSSTWQKIWLKLGYTINDCAEYVVKYKQGVIEHQEWCDITCEKFKKKGFSRQLLNEIASDLKLIEGTHEILKELKRRDIKLFITSGSIRELIEIVLGETSHLFEEIQANHMEFDNGIIDKIEGTIYDFEGKAKYIEYITEKYKLKPHEVLFIGNSDNDDWAYKSGARTLCVNPNNTNYSNARRWHNLIMKMTDLKEITPFVYKDND